MPLNIDWQQILLHLLNFVLLFAILYFLLYKPVKQFMDKRAEYYKKLDDETRANLAESEKKKAEYQASIDSVEDEIRQKKHQAAVELEELAAAKTKSAEAEAVKIITEAHKSIEAERAKMLREAENEITDMVAAAADKLVAQSTTSQAFDQFLDAAKRG